MCTRILIQNVPEQNLGTVLNEQLANPEWTNFYAAVAFAKNTGVRHIENNLRAFSLRGVVQIIVGVDSQGTSIEGLTSLYNAISENGQLRIFHNENPGSSFHPKLYWFSNEHNSLAIIGSNNLTEGGLFTNHEASAILSLDIAQEQDRIIIDNIRAAFSDWMNPDTGLSIEYTPELAIRLVNAGYLSSEAELAQSLRRTQATRDTNVPNDDLIGEIQPIFSRLAIHRPTRPVIVSPDEPEDIDPESYDVENPPIAPPQVGLNMGFLMTLQRTDVGYGQTTAGTSQRSPEIFIPLSARNHDPMFWGWQDLFISDPGNPNKMDRSGVPMRIGGQIVSVNMMTWPAKHDFRLRSAELRRAGNINDILKLERSDGTSGFSYYVEIIPAGSSDYIRYLAMCNNPVRNSQKRWGYY